MLVCNLNFVWPILNMIFCQSLCLATLAIDWSWSFLCIDYWFICLQYNVALPPAILSRFDLVYVMIDDPDDQTDYHIAHHIVRVHQKREDALAPEFTTAQLKRYIAYAKTLKPKVALVSCK